jgi:hypothetical protein
LTRTVRDAAASGAAAVKEGDVTHLAADRYPATTGKPVDFSQV